MAFGSSLARRYHLRTVLTELVQFIRTLSHHSDSIPLDFTRVCTSELCAFSDDFDKIKKVVQ